MIWRAHEADGRISAKNALKIRAALRTSARWERVFEAYQRTQPAVSKNPAQDRARARSWAMLSVAFDNDALIAALRRTWADGFALGIVSADDAVRQAKELKKAEDPDYIDWANWKPGDSAAALLLKPTRAFQRLLEAQGVTIRGIDRTGYDRLGTALSDAISLGLSGRRAAKLIQDSISDPARALTIAITETNRAISRATIERYQTYGLEQMEWVTSDPCDKCVLNEGTVVNLGQAFPSGDTQPPVHPNCRCALLPVVPDFDAPVGGIDDIIPVQPTVAGIPERLLLDTTVEAQKFYDTNPPGIGEERLAAAYKTRPEYNQLPQVLDPDEFDRLRDSKEGIAVYRGIQSSSTRPAGHYIDQYKNGSHYAGYGMYGNGTYTSTNFGKALTYSKFDETKVMEILIPKNANFVPYLDIRTKATEAIKEIDAFIKLERSRIFDEASAIARATKIDIVDVPLWQEWTKRESQLFTSRTLLNDEGTAAVLFGYDGISMEISDTEKYYIILNRGKVKIKR